MLEESRSGDVSFAEIKKQLICNDLLSSTN